MFSTYRIVARVAHRLPYPPGALRASLSARRGAAARWRAWAQEARGANPLIWTHAASVGELCAIEPVLGRLRRALPGISVVFSHTSPSLSGIAVPPTVAHRDFLPLDEPAHLGPTLDALRPAVLVFSRGDLWPELVQQATARGVPSMVVGGTVRPTSHRLRGPARSLLTAMHRSIAWVGAVTDDDAGRWIHLGVPSDRVTVTGDPRHDHILERIPSLEPARAVAAWAGADPVFAAGSVEPSDDDVLAEALHRLGDQSWRIRTVIVPHDPSPRRVRTLRGALAQRRVRTDVWEGPPHPLPGTPAVIVTTHGLLADLYLAASVAYVGGGFRRGRLHATAEPAAFAIPLIVGPRWQGGADVSALLTAGGALDLPPRNAGFVLAGLVRRLLQQHGERERRGLAARAALGCGAPALSVNAVLSRL